MKSIPGDMPMKLKFLLLFLIASPLIAQEPDSSSAIFQLREAERNFARASVMYGRNAAFTEYFAENSVIFTDKWITTGKQFSRERKPSPVVLKWEPEFMDIAASRDFGISTGPWESQEYRPNTSPLSTGYFLTVWKKSPAGLWQVILDAGSSTPVKNGKKHEFNFPAGADKPVLHPEKVDISLSSRELLDREGQILRIWKSNPVPSTYRSFFAPNARMQINGHVPSSNADTIKVWTGKIDKSFTLNSSGSGTADSGDMGFTYGTAEYKSDKGGVKGNYVRIWRKLADNKWYIILEMMNID
jgi:ketosteroid isomerase-like protein